MGHSGVKTTSSHGDGSSLWKPLCCSWRRHAPSSGGPSNVRCVPWCSSPSSSSPPLPQPDQRENGKQIRRWNLLAVRDRVEHEKQLWPHGPRHAILACCSMLRLLSLGLLLLLLFLPRTLPMQPRTAGGTTTAARGSRATSALPCAALRRSACSLAHAPPTPLHCACRHCCSLRCSVAWPLPVVTPEISDRKSVV